MSITTRAYGGIGILLWMNDMKWPTTSKESCEHPERVGQKFCPTCGTKVETIVEETDTREYFVDAFQATSPDKGLFLAETVYYEERGWKANPAEPLNHCVFIGYGRAAGGYGEKVFKSIPAPTSDVMEALQTWEKAAYDWLKAKGHEPPDSIFDVGDFGLHIINYVS